MQEITVRRMNFQFPEVIDPLFIDRDPQQSYFFLGTWMMLPYLEPYLMRSIREAIGRTDDVELKEEMSQFCAQEGQHYQQHARANEILRKQKPGFEKLLEVEKALDAEFRAFTANKSLKFNLAYAEGFESLTCAVSRAQFEADVFQYMSGPLKDLMRWHIMEEIEHRTVAFDAYETLYGGYFYRLFVGAWAQTHFLRAGMRLAKIMMESDPETMAMHRDWRSRLVRGKRALKLLRHALPKVLNTYMPWYSPHKVRIPSSISRWQLHYSEQAVSAK